MKVKDKEDGSWAMVCIHKPDGNSADNCGLIHGESLDVLFVNLESTDDEVCSYARAVNKSVVPVRCQAAVMIRVKVREKVGITALHFSIAERIHRESRVYIG
jgi:hypothetical protein